MQLMTRTFPHAERLAAGAVALLCVVWTVPVAEGVTESAEWDGLRLFVDAARPANGDGQSWDTAYRDLAPALLAATGSVEALWIAAGVYTGAVPFEVTSSNLTLYGSMTNGATPPAGWAMPSTAGTPTW